MEGSCAAAVAAGLPAVAFTEHLDFTRFRAGALVESYGRFIADGVLTAPPFDAAGYFASIDRCRHLFPGLRILTGLEIGQPHRNMAEVAGVLRAGRFERILGSLHCLADGDGFAEPAELFRHRDPAEVFREYLAEVPAMVAGSDVFDVFAHIDYPVRSWPVDARPFRPEDFEEELRGALRAIADGERALEVNAKVPLSRAILEWWVEEGGRRVTFGSDGHEPWTLGRGLSEVAALAAAAGFRPDASLEDPWIRGS